MLEYLVSSFWNSLRRIKRCDLVLGIMSQGIIFEVSKTMASSVSFSSFPASYGSGCKTLNSHFSRMSDCFLPWWLWTNLLKQHAASNKMISFVRVALPYCLFTALEQWQRNLLMTLHANVMKSLYLRENYSLATAELFTA